MLVVEFAGTEIAVGIDAQAQGAVYLDVVVAKLFVGEDTAFRGFFKVGEQLHDARAVVDGGFAVFLTEIFAQRAFDLRGVDELHLATTARLFAIGDNPNEGADAGVVETLFGHGDDGFEEVVFDEVAAEIAFATASIAGEKARTVVHLDNAGAEGGVFHTREVVGKKEHLGVAHIGDEAPPLFGVVAAAMEETRVGDVFLLVGTSREGFEVVFPSGAEGGIGDAEVELHAGVLVVAQGGTLGKAWTALPLVVVVEGEIGRGEEEVGFAGGEGFGLELLSVEVDGVAAFGVGGLYARFGNGENAARAAGSIVDGIGAVGDAVFDGEDGEVGKEFDIVARGEVFSGFGDAVFFIELAQELLKERAHGVVVDAREKDVALGIEEGIDAEIDGTVGELLEDGAQTLTRDEIFHHLLELEMLNDVLHIARKSIEIVEEGLMKGFVVGVDEKAFHGVGGKIVEGKFGNGAEHIGHFVFFESRFAEFVVDFAHLLVGGLEQEVETAEHHEGEDDAFVVAFVEDVDKDVVGDVPNEGEELGVLRGIHIEESEEGVVPLWAAWRRGKEKKKNSSETVFREERPSHCWKGCYDRSVTSRVSLGQGDAPKLKKGR